MKHTLLVSACNEFLKRQPQITEVLSPYAGKSVALVLDRPVFRFQFRLEADGLFVADDSEVPDVTLSHQGALPRPPFSMGNLMAQLDIRGNVELADALGRAFQRVEFNPGDWLQPLLGDVLSHRLAQQAAELPQRLAQLQPQLGTLLDRLPKPPAFLREQLNDVQWLGEKLLDKLRKK